MWSKIMSLLAVVALFACSAIGARQAVGPGFTVTAHIGAVEVRQYGARIAAETMVDGDEETTRSAGFRRLADYISGANKSALKIAMTQPVAQDVAGADFPVAQSRSSVGRWRIRFFMPSNSTLATLPQPDDASISLVPVPLETLAVLRFPGTASPDAVASRTADLVAALEGSAWRPAGAPVAWFYDPPWTLPPLRRNEVAIPVSPK